jgi:hypothetical protein
MEESSSTIRSVPDVFGIVDLSSELQIKQWREYAIQQSVLLVNFEHGLCKVL